MNQLSLREKKEISPFGDFSYEQIELIKQTVCKGATDAELQFFLCVCVRTGLDPFMKQIYSIPRSGQRTIQVSIDGSRSIADKTNRYMPGRKSSFEYTPKGELLSATSYVKKLADDGSWHEIEAEANWSEYNPGNNPIWKKMPRTMLAKCAEALALRKAFPSHLSGIYTKEEMDQADSNDINVKPLYTIKDSKKEEPLDGDQLYQIRACVDSLDKETQENFFSYLKKKCNTDILEMIPSKDFEHIYNLLKVRLDAAKKAKQKEEAKIEEIKPDIKEEVDFSEMEIK